MNADTTPWYTVTFQFKPQDHDVFLGEFPSIQADLSLAVAMGGGLVMQVSAAQTKTGAQQENP